MKRIISLTALLICAVMLLSLIPVSVSAAEFTGEDRIVIVLDPGHGTAGEANEYNNSEGAYNMRTAKYMKAALEKNSSFIVYMTNEQNSVDLSHYERAVFADSVNADVMISIHYNSAPNVELKGMEAWCSVIPKFDTADLAYKCVEYGVAAVPGLENGGVNKRKDNAGFYWNEEYQWDIEGEPSSGVLSDYYGIITWGLKFGVPTFILEELYLSNEGDKALATDANIKAMAEAQAKAIIEYYTGHTHTYGEVQTDIPLSCITAGKQSVHCTECGHRKDVTTVADAPDAEAHFYRAVDPADPDGEWTCVYTHSLINKAKLQHEHHTGEALTGAILPSNTAGTAADTTVTTDEELPRGEDGHIHDYEVTGGYEVTGAQNGYAIYTCSVCEDKYREDLYATHDCDTEGHVLMAYSLVPGYGEQYIDKEVTCETDGEKYCFCMVCNYAGNVVEPAPGHQYAVVNEIAATCDVEGKIEKHCSVCADVTIETIPVLEHQFETELVESSCTAEGERIDTCTLCGKENIVSVPPAGHSYVGEVKTEASGSKDGERVYTCAVCGHVQSEVIPAYGEQAFSLDELAELPLPIIAFAIVIVLLVAAVIVIPVIIRKRRAIEDEISIEAMDFSPEDVKIAADAVRSDIETEDDRAVSFVEDTVLIQEEPMPELVADESDDVVAGVIPEIAQAVVESEPAESFSPEDIDIPVEAAEAERDGGTAREEALEALKKTFIEDEDEE